MTTFFIIVFLLYCAGVMMLAFGWARLNEGLKIKPVTSTHFISVIVPFRNEADNLPIIIKGVANQDYTISNFELIMVDDHSDDSSVDVVNKITTSNLKLLQLPAQRQGKKTAIDFGIQHAKGTVIVTTDADCLLQNNWLAKINERFQSDDVKLLIGPVRIDPINSLFSKIQSLEFASLIGSSGATLGLGFPSMCNGANLSFLKSAYLEVNGYEGNENIPSGDDEFLMRKIATRWKDGIMFLNDAEAIVATASQRSVNDLFNQRLRWAGKWKHNSSAITKGVALVVLGFHFSFLLFFASVSIGLITLKSAVILWAAKMFFEMIFLFPVCSFLKLRWNWISFLTLQFTYSFYVVVVGVLSQVKKYSWKGRR